MRRNNVLFFPTSFKDSNNQHAVFFDKDLFFAWRHLWLTLNLKLLVVPRLKIVPAFGEVCSASKNEIEVSAEL